MIIWLHLNHIKYKHRPYAAARLSQTVKYAQPFEEGDDDDAEPEDVEIVKVDTACLEKVVEFLKHYNEENLTPIKTPLEDNTFDGVVTQEWYRDFIKGVDQQCYLIWLRLPSKFGVGVFL